MRREQAAVTQVDSAAEVLSTPEPPTAPQTCTIPIRILRPGESPGNRGENREYITTLARSPVRLPPIFVHRRTMRILDGMHRLKAAELRGDQSIDVVFFDGDEPEAPGPPPNNLVRLDRPRPAAQRHTGLTGTVAPPAPQPSTPVHQVAAEFGLEPDTVVDVLSRLCQSLREAPGAPYGGGPRDPYDAGRPGPAAARPAPAAPAPRRPDDTPALLRLTGSCDATELVLDRVCDELFASFTRRDQRLRARQYLWGLLGTPGRKTIRNIAAFVEGPGIDQRLHHFISDSTWDWEPVRTALTRYVARTMEPEAWVIRPVLIPKVGQQPVAVSRRFDPTRGKAVNGQRAVGVLAVSETAGTPVSWRLQVPKDRVEDVDRQRRAGLSESIGAESIGECTARALLQVLARTGGPDRPVVLDGRDMERAQLLRPLHAAEVPMFVRISATLPLRIEDPALTGHRTHGPLPSRRIVEAARFRRRPVDGPDPSVEKGHLITTVDVRWPADAGHPHPGAEAPMRLIAVSPVGENVCEELWLTTLTTVSAATALKLARLVRRVDRDLESVSRNVGIWDFSGRSFPGWHRHVTLASIAHLVRLLARTDYRSELG